MGIYTQGINRVTGYEELSVAEGYEGEMGLYQIALENIQNDMALFEAVLISDFNEVAAMNEGAETDVQIYVESTGMGFLEKIKKYLKMAYEKVKGLIKSFITNLTNVVIRDNKKFVEKYRNEVLKKDLAKMKFKWAMCKENKDSVIPKVLNPGELIDRTMTKAEKEDSLAVTVQDLNTVISNGGYEKLGDMIQDAKSEETKNKLLTNTFGFKVQHNTLLKDVIDALYNEKDEHEGLSSALLSNIMSVLTESKTTLKNLNDANKNVDKLYNKRLKVIDDFRKKFSNMVPSGGSTSAKNSDGNDKDVKVSSDEANNVVKYSNYMYASVQTEQDVVSKTLGTSLNIIKSKIKESRSLFARAAAYNPKAANEDTELLDAVEDDEEHVMEEAFEGIYAY